MKDSSFRVVEVKVKVKVKVQAVGSVANSRVYSVGVSKPATARPRILWAFPFLAPGAYHAVSFVR